MESAGEPRSLHVRRPRPPAQSPRRETVAPGGVFTRAPEPLLRDCRCRFEPVAAKRLPHWPDSVSNGTPLTFCTTIEEAPVKASSGSMIRRRRSPRQEPRAQGRCRSNRQCSSVPSPARLRPRSCADGRRTCRRRTATTAIHARRSAARRAGHPTLPVTPQVFAPYGAQEPEPMMPPGGPRAFPQAVDQAPPGRYASLYAGVGGEPFPIRRWTSAGSIRSSCAGPSPTRRASRPGPS